MKSLFLAVFALLTSFSFSQSKTDISEVTASGGALYGDCSAPGRPGVLDSSSEKGGMLDPVLIAEDCVRRRYGLSVISMPGNRLRRFSTKSPVNSLAGIVTPGQLILRQFLIRGLFVEPFPGFIR